MNLIDSANNTVWENFETVSKQPFRQAFHLMPPTGWMNDPNGLIYFKGEFHVFYQHYPYGTFQGPMYWGHLSSEDLLHWKHRTIALAPDTEYDQSCFSGSAVEKDGQMILIYTSHDDLRSIKEMQSIASSIDGHSFKKYEHNPVIRKPPIDASFDFRDPKVWKHNNVWFMVIGSSKDQTGQALLFQSDNLLDWQEIGVVLRSNGEFGHVWECPDIYKLGDLDILAFSPIDSTVSRNTLVVGSLDYESGHFTPEFYQEADFGEDFYAMQSFEAPDGRRLMIAWMEKWRKDYVTAKEGWVGAMTLFRELSFEDGKVKIRPISELSKLRGKCLVDNLFDVKSSSSGYLEDVTSSVFEIELKLTLNSELCRKAGLRLRMSLDKTQETLVYYDRQRALVVCDRSKSGYGSQEETCAPVVLDSENSISLRIFVDNSSIEIFINDGDAVITNRIYPDSTSVRMDLFADGGQFTVPEIKVWTIQSIWSEPTT